jgi:phytoene dehydrogenase-like protein
MGRTAVVVGSGPNGLAAAIVLAQAGIAVEVREARALIGGAASSGELTLPGFIHDLGSAVHPMAVSSPFFSKLGLQEHGLRWIWSPVELAHPLDDGSAVLLHRDVRLTAEQFGTDAAAYRARFEPIAQDWRRLVEEVFRPLRFPRSPLLMARFGIYAVQPAALFARIFLRHPRACALFAGIAAHSDLKLGSPLSSGFGLTLGGAAHALGWPIPEGGAGSITQALASVLRGYGGNVSTNAHVGHLNELAYADLKLLDVTPRQFLRLSDGILPAGFRRALERYEYGPGAFKVDWALHEPIPWRAKDCAQAITVHLGGSLEEIVESERAAWEGRAPDRPFILLVQPSLFDPTRAPAGRHTAWAYCHVPNGWPHSALEQIEAQVERFAPGFRDCVMARSVWGPSQLENWNENLVGGDIVGGAYTPRQFVLRPTWRRHGTPIPGVYLCSSSTPPGGAVHGLCGYYAARTALSKLGA